MSLTSEAAEAAATSAAWFRVRSSLRTMVVAWLVGVALALGPAATTVAAAAPPVALTLPAPTGHQLVGTVSLHLVDRSRPDPWVPTETERELVVQIWYPAAETGGHERAPWITPATQEAYEEANGLPAGALDWPMTHAYEAAGLRPRRGGWPVVLYSPGLGGMRTESTAIVEELASQGYVVVTVDHVHDSTAVELPDGRVETSALPELTDENELAVAQQAVEARVADIRFVLDQLEEIDRGGNPDASHQRLPCGLHHALDLDRVGILGFSDGGPTAMAALHLDSRIKASVDLDGSFWTADSRAGSDRPVLLVGIPSHTRDSDPTWATLWANQTGPKLQLNLEGSAHGTFTDLAVLVPQAADALDLPPEQVTGMVGTIDGPRAVTILRRYLTAYFDLHLRHHDNHLLDGPSDRYPEITFTP